LGTTSVTISPSKGIIDDDSPSPPKLNTSKIQSINPSDSLEDYSPSYSPSVYAKLVIVLVLYTFYVNENNPSSPSNMCILSKSPSDSPSEEESSLDSKTSKTQSQKYSPSSVPPSPSFFTLTYVNSKKGSYI